MNLCNTVFNHNISNLTKLKFVCKHKGVSKDIYRYILGFVVEYPFVSFFEKMGQKCLTWNKKHHYHACTSCNYQICKTHEYPWHCLKCDLILCEDCYKENNHDTHTSWDYDYYQI